MAQAIQKQSCDLVEEQEGKGWKVVGISEKKPDTSWAEGERCFMVALRKPEHAHLPFPGSMDTTAEEIPNRAVVILWHGQNYTVRDTAELSEFSGDPRHPTTNEIMEAMREGIAKQN